MVFEKIKKFLSDDAEEKTYVTTNKSEFIELSPDMGKEPMANIMFKYYVLNSFSDIRSIIADYREGHTVALIKISSLKAKDVNELKRAVIKVKKTCEAMGGNLVGVDENWIVATPSFVQVNKGEIKENAPDVD